MMNAFKVFLVPTSLFEPYLGESSARRHPAAPKVLADEEKHTTGELPRAAPPPRELSHVTEAVALCVQLNAPAARHAPPATPSFDLADVLAEFDADELELCLF